GPPSGGGERRQRADPAHARLQGSGGDSAQEPASAGAVGGGRRRALRSRPQGKSDAPAQPPGPSERRSGAPLRRPERADFGAGERGGEFSQTGPEHPQ